MAVIICAGDIYPLVHCGINCAADAETQGHLKVGAWTKVMCYSVIFAALPPWWGGGWGWGCGSVSVHCWSLHNRRSGREIPWEGDDFWSKFSSGKVTP